MEPVGQPEIAERLGVKLPAVWQWRQRDLGFPKPMPSSVGGGPWWDWPDVERWAVQTGRLKSDDKGEQA